LHLVDESDAVPLTSVDELVAYFQAAGKPQSEWRIGTEHELIGVRADGSAPGYDGPDGIGSVLARYADRGWEPVLENGHVIALTCKEAQELENIFSLLLLGSFVGFPAPPTFLAVELLPYMEREMQVLQYRADTSGDMLAELCGILGVD